MTMFGLKTPTNTLIQGSVIISHHKGMTHNWPLTDSVMTWQLRPL